jgi:dTMP kinase
MGKIVEVAVEMFSLGVKPDLTVFLDAPPKEGLQRIKKKDRIESRALSFHNRLRKGYLLLAKKYPRRIKVVDARGRLPEIYKRIDGLLKTSLRKKKKK